LSVAPDSRAALRYAAGELAGALPPLMAAAEQLAATVMLGEHGRRRAGTGDEFWQYRPAHPADPVRLIDWRRSARSDALFVREREWQAAQSVSLWVDAGRSMAYSGAKGRPEKGARARLVAMALAVLLLRAGERVGTASGDLPPRAGQAQLLPLAAAFLREDEADYAAPAVAQVPAYSRMAMLSDFLGDVSATEAAVARAADRGVKGLLVQILDPVEESFPFDGRTIFESMGGGLRHESLRAGDLRNRYRARLEERKGRLETLARRTGWHWHCHHTDAPALTALSWAWHALDGGRR